MIKVGDKFPQFQLNDSQKNVISSNKLLGKKFIIFSYPKASTPLCTKEVCSIRDWIHEFQKKRILLFGLSKDSYSANQKFVEKHNLSFPLLCDPEKMLISKLGIYGKRMFFGKEVMSVFRQTFLVDENQQICSIIKKVTAESHGEQILEACNQIGW